MNVMYLWEFQDSPWEICECTDTGEEGKNQISKYCGKIFKCVNAVRQIFSSANEIRPNIVWLKIGDNFARLELNDHIFIFASALIQLYCVEKAKYRVEMLKSNFGCWSLIAQSANDIYLIYLLQARNFTFSICKMLWQFCTSFKLVSLSLSNKTN